MKLNDLFNARGRLPRGRFWLQGALFWVLFYLLSAASGVPSVLVWLVNGVALVLLAVLCIQRLHDRDYSGWWMLVVVVPVVGALWLLWQLALRRGVAHDNRWGVDPRQPRGDYLVVG